MVRRSSREVTRPVPQRQSLPDEAQLRTLPSRGALFKGPFLCIDVRSSCEGKPMGRVCTRPPGQERCPTARRASSTLDLRGVPGAAPFHGTRHVGDRGTHGSELQGSAGSTAPSKIEAKRRVEERGEE